MKGVLPIIIATVIVLAILLSSLYFITTVNIRSSITTASYSVLEWMRLEEELDTLAYIALRESSQYADTVFLETYDSLTADIDYSNLGQALDELRQAVIEASNEADKAMDRKFNWIIGNWTLLKEREGYVIVFEKTNSTYYVGFGEGFSNVYFRVKIVNINGEYREFIRNYTVYFGLKMKRTNIDLLSVLLDLLSDLGLNFLPEVNLTLVFKAEAYIDFNGAKQYYVIDETSGKAITNDVFGALLNMFIGYQGGGELEYTPAGMYYYGRGETEMVYYIDATTAITGFLMTIYEGDVVGSTSYIDVDGMIARSAISITG